MSTIVTRTGKGSALTWAEADANFTNLNTDKLEASTVHAATSKTTPVDADEFPGVDSAATYGLKKFTWANIKATLKTYFDTLYWGGVSADIASATILDLTGSRGIVRVTGTTATTGVTLNAGQRVECIAVNAWPLTYHATNMPLPTNGFNYTCSGNDKVIFTKDGNGTLFVQFEKLSGFPNAGGGDQAITLGALGTATQITANTNDWALSQYWGGARISSDAARDVTGILSGWNSRTLTLHNVGSYAITLKDESASSIAASRFALQNDIVMQPDAVVVLQYDATTARWRAANTSPIVYSGSAPVYGCRAWVNFNGTGTPAIRASGNVTSITDNGTGDYTINFTTALPDADYSCVGNQSSSSSGVSSVTLNNSGATAPTASACRVNCFVSGAAVDPTYVNLAFFR